MADVEKTGQPVQVLFNADAIVPPLTGIGLYARELLYALRARPDAVALRAFSAMRWLGPNEDPLAANAGLQRGRRWLPFPGLALKAYLALRDRRFRALAARFPQAVLHSPNFLDLPHCGPRVITIHDMAYVRFANTLPAERLSLLQKHLPAAAKRADAIIVPSHFVKNEVTELLQVPSDKVHVVYHGVDKSFHHLGRHRPAPGEPPAVLRQLGLRHENYLLCVATPEPRKNLMRLLDAWFLLPATVRRQYHLVLVGAGGWKNRQLHRRLQFIAGRSNHHGRVVAPGYVAATDLPHLYAHAAGFVLPSLYEGFGLPLAEAMACGVPTAVATGSALDEVASELARRFDPFDLEAMSQALLTLLEDTAWRQACAQANRARAAEWQWSRCAEKTLSVYQSLVRSSTNHYNISLS